METRVFTTVSASLLLFILGYYLNRYLFETQKKNIFSDYDAWKNLIEGKELPLMMVDLKMFDHNLKLLGDTIKNTGKHIRIATKSLRIPELISRVLNKGFPFKGLMCYTVKEAEFLNSLGMNDFLIAYPTVQESDLAIVRQLLNKEVKISLVIDSLAQMKKIAEAMENCSKPLSLIVEVDTSLRFLWEYIYLGVRRSPVRTLFQLKSILEESRNFPSIKIEGAMTYEALVAGLPDRDPFNRLQNPIAYIVRRLGARYATWIRKQIPGIFQSVGIPLHIFNGGGTGSINFTAKDNALTEVTFGSGLLCPHLFDYYSNLDLKPAAFFALQTVRSSDSNYVTCLGGGYIASGAPGWERLPIPVVPEGLALTSTEGCGEVQTPLVVKGSKKPTLGEPVFFRHAKAGELAEHFNEVLLVTEDKKSYPVQTYRGFRKCFL